MTDAITQAHQVFKALNDVKTTIDDMMAILESTKSISINQKLNLQEMLKSLKNDIQSAAKYGTVNRAKQPMNAYEKAYYWPTMTKISANLSIAVNSHPIKSDWYSYLFDAQSDITHMTFQLKEQLPEF